MLDPMGLYLLTRLHRDDLLREAAGARLAQEALAPGAPTIATRVADGRQIGVAWLGFIIQRFRLAAGDSSSGARAANRPNRGTGRSPDSIERRTGQQRQQRQQRQVRWARGPFG
jgi:hypothetical protein